MAALRCGVDGAFGPWEGWRSRFERFADGIKDGVARLYAGLRPVFVRWLVSAHVRSRQGTAGHGRPSDDALPPARFGESTSIGGGPQRTKGTKSRPGATAKGRA